MQNNLLKKNARYIITQNKIEFGEVFVPFKPKGRQFYEEVQRQTELSFKDTYRRVQNKLLDKYKQRVEKKIQSSENGFMMTNQRYGVTDANKTPNDSFQLNTEFAKSDFDHTKF